jgi:hypothetical protein
MFKAKERMMISLRTWTGACIAFVLLGTLMSGMAVAQDPKVQDPKIQDAKVFEGMLTGIDQNAKVLTLKAGDKEMQFTYSDQTELVAPEKDGKPIVVTQGTKMKVHYTESEKTNIAMRIEITETTAEAR